MMNTKPKYNTKYAVTFWSGDNERDSIVEDNLTEALRFVRDLWPDATLHGSPEGIDARKDGETVAEVRLLSTLDHVATPERPLAPLEVEIERLIRERESLSAELAAVNARNAEHKRDIERAKCEMLDKSTLIDELLRWTETAKRERKERDKWEAAYRAAREQIEDQYATLSKQWRKQRETEQQLAKWKAEAQRDPLDEHAPRL